MQKAFKVKERLDVSFLRCSKRIFSKLQGYKDAESAKKAKDVEEVVDDNIEPMPLAIIPPGPSDNAPAPHLSKEIM